MSAESAVSNRMQEPEASRERVAEAVERARAAVRQRQAELATLGDLEGESAALLLDLRAAEYLREPQPVSPRPLLGGLLVLARKAFYQLFFKWWSRPVVEQQNRFNHAAAELLRELQLAAERRERRLRDLESRIANLERGGEPTPRT
jgi:hypothetical protein